MMNKNSPTDLNHKWQVLAQRLQHYAPQTISRPNRFCLNLSTKRALMANLIAFLLQYIGVMLHTSTFDPGTIWFDAGTACALVFMRGNLILPGLWLGTLAAYLNADAPVLLALTCATLITTQPLLLRHFCYRFNQPSLMHYRVATYLVFVLACGVLTATISGLLIAFCWQTIPHSYSFTLLWLMWWLANLNGLFIFSSALYTWDTYFPQLDQLTAATRQRLILLFTLLAIASVGVLLSHTASLLLVSMSSMLALALFISAQYGKCAASSALFCVGFLFGMGDFFSLENSLLHLLVLQISLLSLVIASNLLARVTQIKK